MKKYLLILFIFTFGTILTAQEQQISAEDYRKNLIDFTLNYCEKDEQLKDTLSYQYEDVKLDCELYYPGSDPNEAFLYFLQTIFIPCLYDGLKPNNPQIKLDGIVFNIEEFENPYVDTSKQLEEYISSGYKKTFENKYNLSKAINEYDFSTIDKKLLFYLYSGGSSFISDVLLYKGKETFITGIFVINDNDTIMYYGVYSKE